MKKVSLKDLVIGKGHIRKVHVEKEITELADSIKTIGQLHPIVICPSADQPGKFEIIIGQRRFLAIYSLGRDDIFAVILNRSLTEEEAKILAISESQTRQLVSKADIIDACTALYRVYGDIKVVAEKTGLPPSKIRDYVKYDSLSTELKVLVDKGGVDMITALRAQKAIEMVGEVEPDVKVALATKMQGMIGAQQEKLAKEVASGAATTVNEIDALIKEIKKTPTHVELRIVLDQATIEAIDNYAKGEKVKSENVIQSLIMNALQSEGNLGMNGEE